MSERHVCPCCGYRTLPERGEYELCPVCFWEDDGDEMDDAASLDGPNGQTLAEGQRTYARYGASCIHCLEHVRPPAADEHRDPDWEPLRSEAGDDKQYFISDLVQLLTFQTVRALKRARASRSSADIARFDGVRAAFFLFVEQVDSFGFAREDAGIERQLDLERDYRLDPPGRHFAG